MALGDILGVGSSGLLAYQRALMTTSHNIANANTEGYSRQRVTFSSRNPQLAGNGFVGSGTNVSAVNRVYDSYLTDQVNISNSAYQQSDHYYQLASRIDNLLADPQVGLSPGLQSFFSAAQGVSNDPTSAAAREVMYSEGKSLSSRFNYLDQSLRGMYNSVNTDVNNLTGEINSLSSSIAKLNKDIALAVGSSGGAQPNDLLDQRELLIKQLSEKVNVSTMSTGDGSINVFIGNGQMLVTGFQSQQLQASRDQFDPTRLEVSYTSGGTKINVSDLITGGQLGAALDFRNNMLDPAMDQFGEIALSVSQTFNEQHQLGMDLNGNPGGTFFTDLATTPGNVLPSLNNAGTATMATTISDVGALSGSEYTLKRTAGQYSLTRQSDGQITDLSAMGFPGGTVTVDGMDITVTGGAMVDGDQFKLQPTRQAAQDIGVTILSGSEIAAAAPIKAEVSAANTGSGAITAGTVNAPPPVNANLQQPVTITFTSATTYDVTGVGTGNPTGLTYTPGTDITYNGWTVQISGAPATGDAFNVTNNTGGVGDNRNMLDLANLQTSLSMGDATFEGAYGQLVAQVGIGTHQAEITQEAQRGLLQQAIGARDAVSGVNLDEEAANLLKYQQAYQAAAKVMTVASEMFVTLLGMMGR